MSGTKLNTRALGALLKFQAAVGRVASSNCSSHKIAYTRSLPHISADACKPEQQAGRSGWPKIAQRKSSISCMQGTPAGLPFGIPGIGLLMEGAMQQAAQCGRQEIVWLMPPFYRRTKSFLLVISACDAACDTACDTAWLSVFLISSMHLVRWSHRNGSLAPDLALSVAALGDAWLDAGKIDDYITDS